MSLHEKLHAFFLLDQQVRGLSSRLNAALRSLKAQQTRRDQTQQQHAEVESQLKHIRAQAGDLENESQAVEQRINKLREQMNTVTSNKEYSALLVEVSTLKNEKGKLEDQALQEMSRADLLVEQLEDLKNKLAEQAKLVTVAEGEVQTSREQVGARLEELQGQRDHAAAELPKDVLSTFNRLADNYDGEAMAKVEEQNKRRHEYTCAGCYTMIPFERLNTLLTRKDEMVTCPSCGRILYTDEQLSASLKV